MSPQVQRSGNALSGMENQADMAQACGGIVPSRFGCE